MDNPVIRILIVEDDSGIQELIKEVFLEKGWVLGQAHRGSEALELLERELWDLVLLDFSLPDLNGFEVISQAKEGGFMPPFLMTTGAGDERLAVDSMLRGAKDYIVKDSQFLERVPLVVERVLLELSVEKRLAVFEETIRKSELKHRMITENINDVIWILDLKTIQFTYVSPSVVKLRGYTAEEILQQSFEESLSPESYQQISVLLPARLKEYHENKKLTHAHIDRIDQPHKNGTLVHTEAVTTFVEDENGEPIEILGVSRDIGERLEMERRLLQSQKLESLGLLAGGVAHDFNNLLAAMMGNLDLAQLKLPPDSPARYHLELSSKAALKASDLIRQMLVYSGQGTMVMRAIDLTRLVQENIDILQVLLKKGVTLKTDLDSSLPRIHGDQGQLQQLIMNLLTNASEAMGNTHGEILIRTGLEELSRETLANLREGQNCSVGPHVFLEVADSGCGMTEESRAKIFDPFFTTKVMGRGLGMAAILGIVRGHDGGVLLESEVNKGTRFRMYFPLLEDELKKRSALVELSIGPSVAGVCPDPELVGVEILVVDDEQFVREVSAAMLEELGYLPVMAASGKEALELIDANPLRFGYILLDLTMPNMDGVEVLQALRARKCGSCIILTSGYTQQKVRLTVEEGLYAGFLQKPFGVEQLKELLIKLKKNNEV